MINSITLQNFQSHKSSTLEFCKGVNTIKGVSDSGKSSILRGLNLVVNNKPSGDSYCSHWGGKTIVKAVFDGCPISNIRDKGGNEYDLDGSVFKALAGNVPEEVQTVINMDEINLQGQMDSPFLLSETSGEVAKIFNRTVDLDVIDSTNKNINSEHKRVKAEVVFQANARIDAERKLSKYNDLAEIGKRIEALKVIQDKLTKDKTDVVKINSIVSKHSEGQGQLEIALSSLKEQEETLAMAERVLGTLDNIESKRRTLEKLNKALDTIKSNRRALEESNAKLKESEATLSTAENVLVNLTLIQEKKEKAEKLQKILDKWNELCYSLGKNKEELVAKEDKLKEITPEVCPLCGNRIGE